MAEPSRIDDGDRLADDAPFFSEAADEDEELRINAVTASPWPVLIVDDDEGVHSITKVVLSDVCFRDRPLELISAYSAAQARDILWHRDDIAAILLDVVMEQDDAGLVLAREIREEMNNKAVRIILRTGQPGQAPEREVILNYDINDYKSKTELTAEKLFSATIAALRSYADITALEEASRQRAIAERARVNLARYFSPNLARHLAEHPDTLALKGERRVLTFLFTDLANFTTLAETLDPVTIFDLMNEYLSGLSGIVFSHEGTIDSVVGDATHVMFGAPLAQPDHAARAVVCALELDAFAEGLKERKRGEGIAFGETRIGVHTGSAIVGNFGGETRFHYTAYGDVLNTTSRLEAANKYLGTRVCVSAETASQIANFAGRPIGTLLLKGKSQGVKVFEPVKTSDRGTDATRAYLEAFAKLETEDPAAVQSFASLVGLYGNDPLSTLHLRRLLAGERGTTITLAQK